MKKFINITILLISGIFFTNAFAQPQIIGDCSTVSYVGFADGMPHYQNNLFQNAAFPSPCYAIVSGPTMVPQMFLERLNHSNNQFETFSGPRPVSQSLFTHVPHGTYRLKLQVPRIVFRASCDGGHIPAHYSNAQHVGWMGHFSEVTTGDTPGTFFSDEVVVGMTTQADISFTFIDEPETGSESAYDYLEGVKINTSQCKNYNRWMIAIIEDGPLYNRYMSTGFLDGKIGGGDGLIFDLTDLWQSWVPQWQFEPFHTYTVQVVLENQQCPNPSWNQLMRTFFVCPTGTGCRLGKEEVREITMGPNPAHSSVWLYNFNPQLESNCRLTINDLSGRVVSSMLIIDNEIDVSALQSGVYVVQIVKEGKRIFHSKLVVAR